MRKGQKISDGDASAVISQYEADLFDYDSSASSQGILKIPEGNKCKTHEAFIRYVLFRDSEGSVLIDPPNSGQPVSFCVGCFSHEAVKNSSLSITIRELSGEGAPELFLNSFSDQHAMSLIKGENEIRIEFPYLCFKPGNYIANLFFRRGSLHTYDFVEGYKFSVATENSMAQSRFFQPRNWNVIHSNLFNSDFLSNE